MLGDLIRGPGHPDGPAASGGRPEPDTTAAGPPPDRAEDDAPTAELPTAELPPASGPAPAEHPTGYDRARSAEDTQDADGPEDGGEDGPAEPPSRMARRRRAVLAVAVAAALVAVGGLGAATVVKSPAERAADTAPPPTTLLTAPAALRVLTRSTVARGLVYPPARYDVTPAAASADITRLYVSALPVGPGDTVDNGRQLAEVSGQPLFVLKGAVPAYRDLRPGSSGPDVTQLQDALADLGHGRGGDPSGTFGPGTAQAVTAYYDSLGYRPPTAGAAAQQAVDTARKAVDADRRAIEDLQARPAPTASAAPGAAASPGAADDRATQLADARQRLADDQAALTRAEDLNGPVVPVGEVVFLPSLPAAVTAVNAGVGAPVSGPLLSLTSGLLAVTGRLTTAQATGIRPGMAVEILSETTGATARGVVRDLGAPTTVPPAGQVVAIGGGAATAPAGSAGGPAAGTGDAADGGQGGPAYVPLRIDPTGPLPAGLSGQNVRITVLRSTTAAPVLSVPVAAVYTEASGTTAVTRVDAAGRRITVPVTTGVDADGYVAVTPVEAAKLQPGDAVAVGR